MLDFRPVCGVDEVPEGRGLAATVGGVAVALFREGDQVFALRDRCPHQGTPIAGGRSEDGEAICPEHGWRFKLATGRCTNVRGNTIPTFACEIRDGRVWVAV